MKYWQPGDEVFDPKTGKEGIVLACGPVNFGGTQVVFTEIDLDNDGCWEVQGNFYQVAEDYRLKLHPCPTILGEIFKPWTNSRQNDRTKAQAIELVQGILEDRFTTESVEIVCGTFPPQDGKPGRCWYVDRATKTIVELGKDGKTLNQWRFTLQGHIPF